ncbi:MAG: carbamoyltransferase [Candidatus Woesebacteria bacterium]|nr:MAG: carbamoyltransferase [Candidatus Woesebacteria bacterium]
MNVLGIYNAHNATAVLVKDGVIVACVSEERFTGKKNQYGFPKHAIDYCISQAKIKSSDIDLVVIPFKYGPPQHSLREENRDLKLNFFLNIYKIVSVVRKEWGELAYRYPDLIPIGKWSFRTASIIFEKFHMASERKYVADYLGISVNKVISVDHHLSHAASVYFSSPFSGEKTLVLTLDGEGDFKCATVSIFDQNKYKILATSDREHSLGYVYQRLTEVLGMKANEHEYKVMGLAPYAKGDEINKIYDKIKNIVYLDPKNRLIFKSKFNTVDTDKFLERELKRVRFDILAAAFQKFTEDKIVEWVDYAVKKTKAKKLLLSGGVFMNIKVNQKIAELPSVKQMFVMPSCGDESTPIGAAFLGYMKLGKQSQLKNSILKNLYFGPEFGNSEVEKIIKSKRLTRKYKVIRSRNIEKTIATLLAKKKIIARASGRMEFGARALGNRSIMGNPTDPYVVRKINDQIKGRDFWMPFAPTILWERMQDYIINPKKIESPYMMMGFVTTELAKKELTAALHQYDFTARPQLLKQEANPKYYKIIKEFEKITGIGGILNTSFNLHGFPIVLGPVEAINTFENSGLEHLALEDYLISKKIS